MSLSFFMYLVDILANLNCFFGLVIIFGGLILTLGLAILNIMLLHEYNERDKEALKNSINSLKKRIFPFLLVCIISCLIPSQKTMYMMLGANYLQNSTIPPKIMTALELKLDDVIVELKKDKK